VPLARRKRAASARPLRVLAASSRRLDLTSKTEAKQLRALRQGWQADAWNYRDSIGELRYAVKFLANASARMRLFVGVEPLEGEDEKKPMRLSETSGIPEQVVSEAAQALEDLARDEGARRVIMKDLSTNISVAGECFVVGRTDPETGDETWSIRSLDELAIKEGPKDEKYELREIPDGPQGIIPWVPLDPKLTTISRVWISHPRFKLLGDSPMRAMLSDNESLTIMRRAIRSDSRSRLGRGLLLFPDEVSIKVPEDDNEDPEADPVFGALTRALMEPISDEGVASAVAPIVIRGPADALKEIRHLPLAPPYEEAAAKTREELIGIIATSFDLPKEVIMGIADLNHWSAWQVDDNTFRHHIEPHEIELCDALTGGYFRPRLIANGVPEQWARRLVIWYDPTELVTHPDQTADALKLHENLVISDEALLRIAGFALTDAPSKQEIQVRLLEKMRTWPPNLVMAFLHAWDPTLTAPAMAGPPAIPGISPTGVDVAESPTALPGRGPEPIEAPPERAPAEDPTPIGPPPSPVTASGASSDHARLSRKLTQIDRDLRTRLQTAANAAMMTQLERLGGRLRSRVAKDETLRTRIAHRRNERVSAILGPDVVTAAGFGSGLPDEGWTAFREQFMSWTSAAQEQAVKVAAQIGGLTDEADALKVARAANILGVEKSWQWLSDALTKLGEHLTFNPVPSAGAEWGELNPDSLVPTGLIRGALGIAGGGELGVDAAGNAITNLGEPIGQVATGATITELLEGSGLEVAQYEWEHGSMTIHPFEPHLDLDGVQFESFEDPRLANATDWPGNAFFLPGDHEGCGCDVCPLWVNASPEDTQ
jgi:hypothetical protein